MAILWYLVTLVYLEGLVIKTGLFRFRLEKFFVKTEIESVKSPVSDNIWSEHVFISGAILTLQVGFIEMS